MGRRMTELDDAIEQVLDRYCDNVFDRMDGEAPLSIKNVEVYSYVLGPSRMHHFDTLDNALAAMRKWHADEMESHD